MRLRFTIRDLLWLTLVVALGSIQIEQAVTVGEIAAARRLFREYADWLGIDLCFQGFASELATLPGVYSPPRRRLLLAWDEKKAPLGCVALRPHHFHASPDR